MAPTTSNPPKRRGPAFKPPRPVKDTQSANSVGTAKRASGATASRPAGITKKAAQARPSPGSPTLISSSESEGDGEDAYSNSDRDERMQDVGVSEGSGALAQPQMEPIPQRLLGKLLQEGFEDGDTKIHRGAMELTTKYMEIFVREAISRAVFERHDANKEGRGDGLNDGFLQVDDLEKLAPQLVLDF